MATIKSYTDIEQSKKLAEILPIKSADMWWAERYAGKVMENGQYIVEENPVYYPSLNKPSNDNYSQDAVKDIPCWSLAALLDVLPHETKVFKSIVDNSYLCECPKCSIYKRFNNPVDACYEFVLMLHGLNLL